MSYALESMLKIRRSRLDKAASALTQARAERNAAAAVLREREDSLSAYNKTREERRDRIFGAILGRRVRLGDLDMARNAVSKIDEEGMLLEEARRKAIEELEKAAKNAETMRIKFVSATKDKTKVELHKESWLEEERRRQEIAEDYEMEEFSGRRVFADDDDSLD